MPQIIERDELPVAVFRILDLYDGIIARCCEVDKDISYTAEEFCDQVGERVVGSDQERIPITESMIEGVLEVVDSLLLEEVSAQYEE